MFSKIIKKTTLKEVFVISGNGHNHNSAILSGFSKVYLVEEGLCLKFFTSF